MKKLLLCCLILGSLLAKAQVFNNEWIDHSKTYYKFKVGKTGLHRISQASLAAAGLGNTPAQHFQLWRNGAQEPIFTSIVTGNFSGNDYIEFWGRLNDGKADNRLYRQPEYQLNDKWSLQTDTSAYFLTVNAAGNNLRLLPVANNAAGSTLQPEPYFMHTEGNYFRDRVILDTVINGQFTNETLINTPMLAPARPGKDVYRFKINNGYAVNVGEYLYSSSYDKAEGFTSPDIPNGGSNSSTLKNLFPYSGGPAPLFRINTSGNAINIRKYRAEINGQVVVENNVDYFTYTRDSVVLPLSLLTSNAVVKISNAGTTPNDRMVVHKYEITYAREFNFGGASSFEFSLPPSGAGQLLHIKGFSFGATAPVLYDLTNGKSYVADVSSPSLVKVALQPSSVASQLVLVSQDPVTITPVGGLQPRTFINYALAANAGDYLIISHPALFAGAGGTNPVESYRLYRSSAEGGAYKAKVYLIQDLVDQFAFGIKEHPASIRNFLMYARAKFPSPLKHTLLIGKGVNYVDHRYNELHPDLTRLNFVPSFGWPASDVLLAAPPGDSQPKTSIGRLSVINAAEVDVYLKKLKEFELAQRTLSPYIVDKAWMKNVVHIVGASEPGLQLLLDNYMTSYKKIIGDTLYGANVTTFTKSSPNAVEQVSSGALDKLFEDGISLITYFGHSSSSTLEFNLNNPEQYNNQGKYPVFIGLGCNAGNFYNFNVARLSTKETLSERYVLAPDRGTIGFVASSHFGIVHYLDITNLRQYRSLSYQDYGKSMGEIMNRTISETFAFTTQEDFYARAQCEETSLHGDPAITLNPHAKPDYVIEQSLLKIEPGFVSVADNSFRLNAKFLNQGRAISRKIVLEVKQEYPNGTTRVIHRDTIPGIRYIDSLVIDVPVVASRDKGSNKFTVTVDADNVSDELFETNNSITREVFIYEDEARPVFPYNFAIVNTQNITLKASTANPFSKVAQYRMELDTTEHFSAPLSVQTVSAPGGVIEFSPGISLKDSTVYYWRIASVPLTGAYNWNSSSFVFLANQAEGANQSHYFQHVRSTHDGIKLDSATRTLVYDSLYNNLSVRNGVYGFATFQEADLTIAVNGLKYIRSACLGGSVVFNVFNPQTFKPLRNDNRFMGSAAVCEQARAFNYEFSFTNRTERKKAMDFMDWIPNGHYVVVRSILVGPTAGAYAADWQKDTATYGVGNSLYHKLRNAGFAALDSFNRSRVFTFVYKKGPSGFVPVSGFSQNEYDVMSMSVDLQSPDSIGFITSPQFGPSKSWKELKWRGVSTEANSADKATLSVIGIQPNGTRDTLMKGITPAQSNVDISSISSASYPFLQLHMSNMDNVDFTPYQLKYWRLTYDPAPEGAVVPAVLFGAPDTLDIGQPGAFKIAFRNISTVAFDSLRVKVVLLDADNIQHILLDQKRRPLPPNDTLRLEYNYDNRKYPGINNIFMEFNPGNDQREQYHFNNFIYRNLFVRGDTLNPLLDVTFDNTHILYGDIVSAKPNIIIKLKDEAKWMLLDTSALVSVQVKYPDANGQVSQNSFTKTFQVDSDTLKFLPAAQAPNGNNTATLDFNPSFSEDGNYELVVSGKDKSNNKAGTLEYRVGFQVISKAMISNMLNYPNPFTTSTAFVFTITGAEVPQNIKIQILTVTGKIVREITKEELGPLRVGRNITEYKWDGTDQFGGKLANGVYIYRVVTNLNGKSLDRYRDKSDDTDKFFNKGYGKMYLMR